MIDDKIVFCLDKCSSTGKYNCENGGICKVLRNGNISCKCKNQFHGKNCEIGTYHSIFIILTEIKTTTLIMINGIRYIS